MGKGAFNPLTRYGLTDKMRYPLALLWVSLVITMSLFASGCGNVTPSTSEASQGSTGTIQTMAAKTNQTTETTTQSVSRMQSFAPLTLIRMLDQQRGWALTAHSVLRTKDGGLHWHNVSPPAQMNVINAQSQAAFINDSHAWISSGPDMSNPRAVHNLFTVLLTVDGGNHWRLVTVSDQNAIMADRPHFANYQEGWIEIYTGAATGHESVDIFRTLNGGLTWNKIATTGTSSASPGALPFDGHKTGISFKDTLNGWATGGTFATDHPWLYVTHDSGFSWQSQSIPLVAGLSNAFYITTPPVFFGRNGLLPVEVESNHRGLVLYVTHNGGASWLPTTLAESQFVQTVYVVDMRHAWFANSTTCYGTSNGGASWRKLAALSNIGEFSFVDDVHGWAIGTRSDNSARLLRTADGGVTWRQVRYTIQ